MFDQVEQRLLSPVHVVEHTNERTLLRLLLEQLAEGPRDFLGGRRRLRLAEQRAKRQGRIALRQRTELLDDLDHRPVRDPLAVR
jgi:hypothetical protein